MTTGEVVYDKKEQLKKIQAWLIPGESLFAVYDLKGGGTGFIGITNRRLIFYDKQFMRKIKAMVTVPYSQIATLSSEDKGGGFMTGRGFFSSSKLGIQTTGNIYYEFDFRGADKAHDAYQLIAPNLM